MGIVFLGAMDFAFLGERGIEYLSKSKKTPNCLLLSIDPVGQI